MVSGRQTPKAFSSRFSPITDFLKSAKDILPSWSWSYKSKRLYIEGGVTDSCELQHQTAHHVAECDLHQVSDSFVRVLLRGLLAEAVFQEVEHLLP